MDDSQKDCASVSLANIINPIIVFFYLDTSIRREVDHSVKNNATAERLRKFPSKRFRRMLKCQKRARDSIVKLGVMAWIYIVDYTLNKIS